MSVLIEGYSVVVRNATVDARYPGRMVHYRQDCPNSTFCSDDHLCRVGFMTLHDAEVFVALLAAKGFTPFRKGEAEDVALVGQFEGHLRPCRWVKLGESRGVPIAWLADSDPGDLHAPPGWVPERSLQYMSAKEAKERLEFVRSDRNVDVYRDRITGQELFVGRTAPGEDRDDSRHNQLYEEATALVQGLLVAHGEDTGPPDLESRRRLERAIPMLEEVVRINPENWAAMWVLGKIEQRFGDHESGLQWFARAHRLNPDQPNVAREAAIAAMEVGRPANAVSYCERALEASPDDPGLQANLALALLFSGKPAKARTIAGDALRRDPADEITARIIGFIDEVLAGARRCPRHVRDLEGQ